MEMSLTSQNSTLINDIKISRIRVSVKRPTLVPVCCVSIVPLRFAGRSFAFYRKMRKLHWNFTTGKYADYTCCLLSNLTEH